MPRTHSVPSLISDRLLQPSLAYERSSTVVQQWKKTQQPDRKSAWGFTANCTDAERSPDVQLVFP